MKSLEIYTEKIYINSAIRKIANEVLNLPNKFFLEIKNQKHMLKPNEMSFLKNQMNLKSCREILLPFYR